MMEGLEMTTNQVEPGSKQSLSLRAEVDTSVPFGSVKDAVTRFGGVGYWKPFHNKSVITASDSMHHIEKFGIEKLEEQSALLEKELILKERETFDVFKELESTKRLIEDLKSKLQKEEPEMNLNLHMSVCDQRSIVKAKEEKENQARQLNVLQTSMEDFFLYPPSAPGLILLELELAKLNLTKISNDMADVRASVEWLNRKLVKERISLLKTWDRITQNSFKISSLEQELSKVRLRLQMARDAEIKCASGDPSDITKELQWLSYVAEHFKTMGEATKLEVLRTMSEIEETKSNIRIAEIWLDAARKMKVAARALEAVALTETNALSNHENSTGEFMQKHEGVTLSFEEYTALTCKARDAEEHSMKRFIDAMLEVDEANLSKINISKRVEEATEEAETYKKALEEALERIETANKGKVVVEEALRKLRSEGHKRRPSIRNHTKLKISYPSPHRRDSRLLDVNGLDLINDESEPVLEPTLTIGQILSSKLLIQHEKENGQKQFYVNRKKFGFTRFSHLLPKQLKKKPILNLN